MDFNKLSRKELEKIIADAQKALKTVEKREMQAARKAAEEAAAEFGFKLAQLVGNASPSKPAAKSSKSSTAAGSAKYANPADPSQTWTGKGRQPKWFKEALAAGKSPEDLEV